ncbi:MAG: hypothetical protein NVSMB52_08060 [Chloroflexota bacterium]
MISPHLLRKGNALRFLIKHRSWSGLWQSVGDKLRSDTASVMFRRDLSIPIEIPVAKIPIQIRPLQESDIPLLLDMHTPGIDNLGLRQRRSRQDLLKASIPTCWVAVTQDGTPCAMEWLIDSSQNEKLRSYAGGFFPSLAPDEVLLEGAFTLESFRGQRVMACFMAMISERARDLGARYVIAFTDLSNGSSLKAHKLAGFEPVSAQRERWRYFRRTLENAPLPIDL